MFYVFKKKIEGQRNWSVEITYRTHKHEKLIWGWYEINYKYHKFNTKVTIQIVKLDDKVIVVNFWRQSETYRQK